MKVTKGVPLLKQDTKMVLETFGYLLSMNSRLMTNRLHANFKTYGYPVTPEQWTVLAHLFQHEGIPQNQLSGLTGKDEPSISRLINNMIKNRLVKRVSHATDRRLKLIYLTQEAKSMEKGLMNEAFRTYMEASEGFQPSEIEALHGILSRLLDKLK
jgi:DNA-binding MarR family transcriptional regulator